jgi:hypothetical protein
LRRHDASGWEILGQLIDRRKAREECLLLLLDGNRTVRAFVNTCSAVQALLDVDYCYIIASDRTLGAGVHACTTRYTFFLVDLGWHQSTSGCPVFFLNNSLDINVLERIFFSSIWKMDCIYDSRPSDTESTSSEHYLSLKRHNY